MSERESGYKKKPVRRENKQVNFRVSEQEYSKLKESADVLNMSVAQFAKSKAKGAHLVKPKFDSDTQKELVTQLSRLGANVNQIAKAIHSNPNLSTDRIELNLNEVKKRVNELWQQLS